MSDVINSKRAPRRHGVVHPSPQAFAYRVKDVQVMGGPGPTKVYELINKGVLDSVKVAGRRLVKGDSLRALLTDGYAGK